MSKDTQHGVDTEREEFYVTDPPDDDYLRKCYIRVDPSGPCEIWPDGDEEPREISMYDVWMEDRNGFGLKHTRESDTPWSDRRAVPQERCSE